MERHFRHLKAGELEGAVRRSDEEVVVLEEAENSEIADQADGQPKPPPAAGQRHSQHQPDHKIDYGRCDDQEEESPVPRSVEPIAREEEQELARCVPSQRPVGQEDEDKKPMKMG